ncbi:MAG: OprO/OprP family phosphate-selective porin [Wenzhouxiangellaceae bacterium]|nr:OprO/OprP family phosphate-selective porin [Wenzhouxiangellaceae bacterium]
MLNWKKRVFALGLGLLSFGAAHADQNEALNELLKALHANGTIDEATYQAIRAVAESDQATAGEVQGRPEALAAQTAREPAPVQAEAPRVNLRGKFEVTSADGQDSFRIGGRVQFDGAVFNEDTVSLGNGSEMRRARLFASGTLGRVWGYKFQYDFTGSGSDGIKDAYIDYKDLGPAKIRVGHFKEPFSLQNLTSDKHINFMERGLPDVFVPERNLGIAVISGSDHWSASAGLFGAGIDNDPSGEDEGYGLSGRLTYAPVNSAGRILHVGSSLSYRDTGGDGRVRFRQRPESHTTDVRFVDTGTIDADEFFRYGLEAAWIHHRLTLQGEFLGAQVERKNGGADADFEGYYGEIMWFLTDDRRPYDGSSGTFKAVKPNSVLGQGGIGAWQLGARISNLDLIDGGIDGGEQDNLTLGLNWFPNGNLRFSFNYITVLDTSGGPFPGDEPDIFALRGQVEF